MNRFLFGLLLGLLVLVLCGQVEAQSPTTFMGTIHVKGEDGSLAVGDFSPMPASQRGIEIRRYLANPTIQFEGITSNIFAHATAAHVPVVRVFGLSSETNLWESNTMDWTRKPFSFAGANSRFVVRDKAQGFVYGAVAHDTSAEFQSAGLIVEEFAHYMVRPAPPGKGTVNNYFGLYILNLNRGLNNRAIFLEGRGKGNGIQFGSGAGPLLYASQPDVLVVSSGTGKGFVLDAAAECIKTLGGQTVWCSAP